MTTKRVATYRADMVMSAQPGAGQTLQDDAQSPRRDIEVAGLKPDAIGIRNPATVVFQVDVGDEVFTASPTRVEAIGEAAESGDWQRVPSWWERVFRLRRASVGNGGECTAR